MERVIFLDIDGVLNSNFWNDSHQKEISDGTLVDEEKVSLFAQLVKKTNAKIILHSGWRIWFDKDVRPIRQESQRLVEMLKKEDIRIDGLTPDLTTEEIRKSKKFSLVKADEILLWLHTHENVKEWVVIDDLELHSEVVRKRQVKPDATVGLTPQDVEMVEKILMKKEHSNE